MYIFGQSNLSVDWLEIKNIKDSDQILISSLLTHDTICPFLASLAWTEKRISFKSYHVEKGPVLVGVNYSVI